MTSATIPVAIHPKEGYPVPIEEAVPKKSNFYKCPECGGILNPRKGTEYTHHYAHAPGVLQDANCPLATQEGIENVLDGLRTSPQEKAENEQTFRLLLGEAPGGVLKLDGVIRSLEWEDVDDYSTLADDIEKISIRGAGIKALPQSTDFHPSEPAVYFSLDPDATPQSTNYKTYALAVQTQDTFPAIHGAWKAQYLSDGDIFVGEKTDAERVTGSIPSPRGEWAFIVLNETPTGLPERVTTYSLGDWVVVGFDVDEDTEHLLTKYGNVQLTAQNPFKTNIVLPAEVKPNTRSAVTKPPGTEVVIGIRPPSDLNPTYEVVSIPKERGYSTIEPTDPGKPRFHTETVPEKGSRRVTIHQSGSDNHRLVHLHADANSAPSPEERQFNCDQQIGIHVENEEVSKVLTPLSADTYQFDPEIKPEEIPECLSFVGPDGYKLSIEATRSKGGDVDTSRREAITFSEFMEEIPHWIREEYRTIEFVFDALGRVSINVLDADPWTVKLTFEQVKDRIRALDEFPDSHSWALVRKVYRAPKGTRHSEFPGGVKKQVRHAYQEVAEKDDR